MLRDYQEQTVQKMLWGITLEGNGLVSIPTGGGKTHIIAEFTKRLGEPVLILVPSKELLEQDLEKLSGVVPVEQIGVYSASMNSKEVRRFTLATIQSAYKHPEQFSHYQVVIIDEADLLNPKNLEGMYRSFFATIGNPHIIGLTATPFRMDSYYRRIGTGRSFYNVETVHTIKFLTRFRERFWQRILHVVHVKDLVDAGFLCPLTYTTYEMIPQTQLAFNRSKSEFDMEDFEQKFNPFLVKTAGLVSNIPSDSVLIFCATITQANNLQKLIPSSSVVTAETPAKERTKMIKAFRTGELRVAINVGVLLVGFDKPNLGAIVIARPTRSLRLHMQLLGRGMRTAVGKTTCLVYDLVGNTKIMGTAESMRIEKLQTDKGTALWNITTNTKPDGWHYAELYSHKLHTASKKEEEES